MKNIFKILGLCAVVLAAASCSKSRAEQMKLAENVKIECTPEVLALVGDKIPVDISVSYPKGYFHPKAIMEVTPVLVYEGGELVGPTYKYQGEKITDNYKVVANDGGTVKESFSFPYKEGVAKSHLELRSVAYYKNKPIEIPSVKVADGVNLTQMLACTDGAFSFKKDNYQEVIHEQAEGQVMYSVNSAVIKNSELRSESIKELQAALKEIASDPRYTVKGTKIVAYASPEGGEKHNAKLSDNRASSAQKAWKKVTDGMSADKLEINSVGQDWAGFQEAIESSNIEDKDLILRVLSMYSDPAVRESEIRNMSKVYTEINKNVFPELRRARFIAEVDYQNFSDAELEELAAKAVDMLDEEAILRVAANASTAERKAELYKIAVKKYASDRAKFNLAVLDLYKNNPAAAAQQLASIKAQDADVENAKGVCELQKGNLDAAEKLFKKAATPEAKANLGTIAILRGDYAAATKELADANGFNKALALLLAGDVDAASKAVTCKCADSNYLRAVIAARKGSKADVDKYLQLATEQNPELKAKAAKDVEFANFR